MGVPLSKSSHRVFQSCMDIHYAFSPADMGRAGPTTLVPPPTTRLPRAATPAAHFETATSSQKTSAKSVRYASPIEPTVAKSPVSFMSTESVVVDGDSVGSMEHSRTVDCWSHANLEGTQNGSSNRRTMVANEECAACSSVDPMANKGPLPVVQVHVNNEGDGPTVQSIRACHPDKALFQLPQSVRLDSSDGYIYTVYIHTVANG